MITLLLAALSGLLLGSFLNVCIYRIPRDGSVVTPRSFCPECGVPVAAFDNIPVVSFLLLRGRCRACHKAISWRYPVVEIATAAIFSLILYRYGLTLVAGKWLLFEALMVILFFTDLEGRILPDEFTLGGLVAGVIFAFFTPVPSIIGEMVFSRHSGRAQSLFSLMVGVLLLSLPVWGVASLYSKVRGREALGLGDVKLLALFGAFLGLESGIQALLIASIAGSVLGAFLLLRHRSAALQFELPFGSFLCGAALLLPLSKTLA